MSTRRVAIGLAALLSWSGHCAAQTADPGPVRVGDRWSYEIKDDATGDLRNVSRSSPSIRESLSEARMLARCGLGNFDQREVS